MRQTVPMVSSLPGLANSDGQSAWPQEQDGSGAGDTRGRFNDLLERYAVQHAARFVFKDNLMQVFKTPHPTPSGMGEQQPFTLDNLVRTALSPNLVTAVAAQDQWRTLARRGLMTSLNG